MRKLSLVFLLVFLLSGCAGIRYVDPGDNPAHLTVHAKASLDPAWVDEFMTYNVLSVIEQHHVKWFGHLEGPWWAIKVYQRDNNGDLRLLRPVAGGIFENVVTYDFDNSREFVIPAGQYKVEVWLEAYMYYCVNPVKTNCGTPTLRIWSMPLEQSGFEPGQRISVTLDASQDAKGGTIKVR